jgi:putative ABC transport system permease protein
VRALLNDVRVAIRILARSWSFSLTVIATLTLGIGASIATFSVVSGVLLHPLPYAGADRLVVLTRGSQASIPDGIDWRERCRSFSDIGLFLSSWDFDLSAPAERVNGAVVEPRFFHVLGLHAERGRELEAADNVPGGPRVVVIAHRLWMRRFNADTAVIGHAILLSGQPATIVGVMPDAADVFEAGVDLWGVEAIETPWARANRGTNNFEAIARLANGVSLDAARTEIGAISRQLAAQYPESNEGKIAGATRLIDALVGQVRAPLVLLLGAITLALLLASANLAGLLLARAETRRPEIALRRALGGGRTAIIRQLMTEGSILVSVGAALGVVLAAAGRRALVSVAPASLPRVAEIGIDARVIVFAVALAVVTGVLFTLGPAIALVRASPAASLSTRGQLPPQSRNVLRGLVVAELVAGLVLVTGAALLVRSVVSLEHVDLGFDPSGVVTADLVLPEARYGTREQQTAAFRAVVQALVTSPGVDAAGSVIGAPLSATGHVGHTLAVEGRPPLPAGADGAADRPVVGRYFAALRIPITAGRAFTEADREDAPPVTIVNHALAERLWPGASPLGARIKWIRVDGNPGWMTVIGVAGDVAGSDPATPDEPAVYMPYVQRTETWQRFGTLVVRARDAQRGAAALREAIARVDADVPLAHVGSMLDHKGATIAQQRFDAIALAVFALGALVLAVQGVYGTVSYLVEHRRREFGVRIAVGATTGDVVRLVLGDAARVALVGLGLGSIVALLATRLLSGLLYGVASDDFSTHAAAAIMLAAAALGGAYFPARRAARADPATSLRQ